MYYAPPYPYLHQSQARRKEGLWGAHATPFFGWSAPLFGLGPPLTCVCTPLFWLVCTPLFETLATGLTFYKVSLKIHANLHLCFTERLSILPKV